jgi:hypothetical protein
MASIIFSMENKSFQFKHFWTCFDDFNEKRIFKEFDSREKDSMDMRNISSLMASQQAIKVNNSHE